VLEALTDGDTTNLSGGLLRGARQQMEGTALNWEEGGAAGPVAEAVAIDGAEQAVEEEDDDGGAPASGAVPPPPPSDGGRTRRNDAPGVGLVGRLLGAVGLGGGSGSAGGGGIAPQIVIQNNNVTANVNANNGNDNNGWIDQGMLPQPQQQQRRGRPQQQRRGGSAVATLFGGRPCPNGPGKPLAPEAVRSVFLFTDGLANCGIRDGTQLVAAARSALGADAAETGGPRARLFTFGFGADHDETLLRRLAEACGGIYYYISTPERIPAAFADALGGLQSVAAQGCEVTIDLVDSASGGPASGETDVRWRTPHSVGPGPGGRGWRAPTCRVGDLLSGEAKSLLVEVDLPALPGGPDAEWRLGTATVAWQCAKTGQTQRASVDLVVPRPSVVDPAEFPASAAVGAQALRVAAADALDEARRRGDAGDLAGAREVLAECRARATALAIPDDAPEAGLVAALAADLDEASALAADRAVYQSRGAKQMASKAGGHALQRSVAQDEDEDECEPAECCAGGAPAPRRAPAFTYATAQQTRMKKAARRV